MKNAPTTVFALAAAMAAAAAFPSATRASAPVSVFDDAKFRFDFGSGGADGALAAAEQIHDVRDASLAVPTALGGGDYAPAWTVADVRLPHAGKTVRGTALRIHTATRMDGSTPQFRQASASFSGLQSHGDAVTVVARVRLGGEEVSSSDCILWSNAYNWGNGVGEMFGFIKTAGVRGRGTTYFPYLVTGGKNGSTSSDVAFGATTAEKRIPMHVGEWYDVAWIYEVKTESGARRDSVTFVVADRSGVRTQTFDKASRRVTSATTTTSILGGMNTVAGKSWTTYNATISGNSGSNFKTFDGWVHQLAQWDRALSIDEVLEAFGKPDAGEVRDIYADAVNWWRFDGKDGGALQTSDVRDVRHWGRPSEGDSDATGTTGPLGGPVWTNMNVYLPGRGVTVASPCLYFPVATNATVNAGGETVLSAHETTLTVPDALRAGSYTVVARIYPLPLVGAVSGHDAYFYNNGLNWTYWSGSEFGLRAFGSDKSGTTFCPSVYIARSDYAATGLDMRANTWYDIAFSVTDNGFDAQGNALDDSLLVAVMDAEHGFRTHECAISTNAYTTFANWTAKPKLGAETGYSAPTDFWNATAGSALNSGNPAKSFHGMIHQLAIWNRALDADEIAEAFGHPNNTVLGVGSADGASGEFAASGGSSDWTEGAPWRDMAGTLDASHPSLSIRFSPAADNKGLHQMLHAGFAAVGTPGAGQTASVEVSLNGKALGAPGPVGEGDDLWIAIPRSALSAGENVLALRYAGGSAASVSLDCLSIGGSWQLGAPNRRDTEFSQESASRSNDFYVGNRNMLNVVRSLTSSIARHKRLHFFVPQRVAARESFTFTARQASKAEGGDTAFRILLNGVGKYATPAGGIANGEDASFRVEAGELAPGWNVIDIEHTGVNWMTFDFFRFAMESNAAFVLIVK